MVSVGLGPGEHNGWGWVVKIRISVDYGIDDENPELEQLVAEVMRAEADAMVESVKRKLLAAGAEVTSLRADYD